MSSPSDPPPHRGLIAREDLPFLPRINWKFWAPVLAVVVAFPIVWLTLREREGRQRRARLLQEHASLTSSLAPDYRAVRGQVEQWVMESVGPYAGDYRAPELSLDALRASPALYARTRVFEIRDRAAVVPSIQHRYPDQLTSCLGVEVALARELFDKGEFLMPSYVDAVRGTTDEDRLHVLRENLFTRLRRDTGFLVDAMRRRYFVLAVDEARASVDGPTRVYVWDVPARRLLLRVRGAGDDVVVIPFRISGIPAAPPSNRLRSTSVSGHDCSIANDVKRALGVTTPGLDHAPEPPSPEPDAGARGDAASDGT